MRNNDRVNSFTDLGQVQFNWPPHVAIPDALLTAMQRETSEIYVNPSEPRLVYYEDDSGNRYMLELALFRMPDGAADVSLGAMTEDSPSAGLRTWTPSCEGRFINKSGVLVAASEEAIDVAGCLFADYYTHFDDNVMQQEHFRYQTLKENDLIWVIRRADRWEVDTTGSVTINDILMSSATVAGELEVATTIDTTSAATLWSTLKPNIYGEASPLGRGLARALETDAGGAGLKSAEILLPRHRVL